MRFLIMTINSKLIILDIFSLNTKLKLYQSYKSVNCYESCKRIKEEPYIKGFYLKKRKNLGFLPRELDLSLSFYTDEIINKQFIEEKYKELMVVKHKLLYISNNKFYLNSIIIYNRLTKGNFYRLFRGMTIGNKKYIKEVYIHKKYLLEPYPSHILISMNWNCKEIKEENKLF